MALAGHKLAMVQEFNEAMEDQMAKLTKDIYECSGRPDMIYVHQDTYETFSGIDRTKDKEKLMGYYTTEEKEPEVTHIETCKKWKDEDGVEHRLVYVELSDENAKFVHESLDGEPDTYGVPHWKFLDAHWYGRDSFELLCALLGER